MANTGYLTSSGIQQVFTTGPLSGSEVTSSYSVGSTFFGPTLNFKQQFISGVIDDIYPCSNTPQIFERYYLEPSCASCITPILYSGTTFCEDFLYDFTYTIDRGIVNASNSPYTVIYYSTSPTFTSNTGSYINNNNINSSSISINVSSSLTSPIPSRITPIYFKAFNSCSAVLSSSFSNTLIVSCSKYIPTPTSSYEPFILKIKNSFLSSGTSIQYIHDGSTYNLATNASSSIYIYQETTPTISVKILGLRSFLANNITTITKENGSIEGIVSTVIKDSAGVIRNEGGDTTIYPTEALINVDNIDSTVDLTIDIDRDIFTDPGTVLVNITNMTPSIFELE
jgi:hypothetical protein